MTTIFTPYTDLLAAAGGVLLATYLVGFYMGRRISTAEACAIAVAAVAALLVLPGMWSGAARLKADRDSLKRPVATVRSDKCLYVQGKDLVRLVAIARPVVARDETFSVTGPASRGCVQLNMLPSRLVAESENPAWTLVAGGLSPAVRSRADREEESGLPRAGRETIRTGPDQALVRNR